MRRLFTLPLLLLLLACSAGAGQTAAEPPPGFVMDGRVVQVAVEGGFFGLVADDGRRFDAGALPEAFRVDGLAVRARLQPLPATVGTHMWGEKVKLLKIERR